MQNRGQEVNMRDLIDDIEQRDLADQSRELSPLLPADDATYYRHFKDVLEEVFSFTKKLIKRKLKNMSETFASLLDESLQTLDMQPGSIVSGVVLERLIKIGLLFMLVLNQRV